MTQKRRRKKTRPTGAYLVLGAAVVCVLAVLAVLLWPRTEEVAPLDTRAKNQWNAESFYSENGFLRYQDAEHLVGIDVSAHQGAIDWAAVKNAGVEFAILRIGYRGSTVGELYEDEQFKANLLGAREAGIKLGAYFFSQAMNPDEAVDEAEYACRLLDGFSLELPLYFDWEVVPSGERVRHEGDVALTDCAIAFCETVERYGYRGGVYFNQTQGYLYYDLEKLETYSLWLAEYGDVPTFRYAFNCLQYSDAGTVAGIPVGVDLDLLFLDEGGEAADAEATQG
mgnify:CR=1 FL=1